MDKLPYDMLALIIYDYLEMSDFIKLFLVCKRWRKFSESEQGCMIQVLKIYKSIFDLDYGSDSKNFYFLKDLFDLPRWSEHLNKLKNFNLIIFAKSNGNRIQFKKYTFTEYSSKDFILAGSIPCYHDFPPEEGLYTKSDENIHTLWEFQNNIQTSKEIPHDFEKIVSITFINNPIFSARIYILIQFFNWFLKFFVNATENDKGLIIISLCIKYHIKYTWESQVKQSDFARNLIKYISENAEEFCDFFDQRMKLYLTKLQNK